jgi:hypothetical protein
MTVSATRGRRTIDDDEDVQLYFGYFSPWRIEREVEGFASDFL